MKYELISYKGWEDTIRLSNQHIELIIPTEIGPRIIHFGYLGGENELFESLSESGNKGGDRWRIYGGHRLWHAPEKTPRTYHPDNYSIHYSFNNGILALRQPVEATTGIEKRIEIRLDDASPKLEITHYLTNCGAWDVELSAWAITAMAPNGTAIIPLPPRQSHEKCLSPTSVLSLWAYTDLSDERWKFGPECILLRHDKNCTMPQKIGASVSDGWVAYVRNGHLFIKQFDYFSNREYPDLGSSVEVFTNESMTEIETLAPLYRLAPGEYVTHAESWHLVPAFDLPESPKAIRSILDKIIAEVNR